jgi:hypothetical protein
MTDCAARKKMRKIRPEFYCFITTVCFLAGTAILTAASADEIYFKSGYSHTGVIVRETKDSISFKTEMGMSTINREKIDFIEKATPEENQQLLKKWRDQERKLEAAKEARIDAERKFEQEQLAKGNVKFEGKWMTPQEKEHVLDLRTKAREDRRKFEQEQKAKGLVPFQYLWVTPEQAQELRQMEPKIYSLSDDIMTWRKTIDSLRAGLTKVATLEEANKYSERIEDLNKKIEDSNNKLGELLKRADEIEAAGVRYVMPEEYRKVMETNSGSESAAHSPEK